MPAGALGILKRPSGPLVAVMGVPTRKMLTPDSGSFVLTSVMRPVTRDRRDGCAVSVATWADSAEVKVANHARFATTVASSARFGAHRAGRMYGEDIVERGWEEAIMQRGKPLNTALLMPTQLKNMRNVADRRTPSVTGDALLNAGAN